MDGYMGPQLDNTINDIENKNYQKYLYIQELYTTQLKIDEEINALSDQLNKLPEMPKSIDRWANSFSSKVKISDIDKMTKLSKRYLDLIEDRKINGSKIKIFAIDNILDQINDVAKK